MTAVNVSSALSFDTEARQMLLSDCGRGASALVSGHEQTFSAFLPDLLNTPAFAASVFNVDRVFVDTQAPSAMRPEKLPYATAKEALAIVLKRLTPEINWPQLPIQTSLQ